MNRHIIGALLAIAALSAFSGQHSFAAEKKDNSVVFDIRAGLNIGGTSPVPLPPEIRKVNGFNPLLLPSLEVGMQLKPWREIGVRGALRLEQKGMWTSAEVKGYKMELRGDDGNAISGYWNGCVDTKVRNTFLTLPVTLTYNTGEKISLGAGPYISYMLSGLFCGNVHDGYLRAGTPTGDRIVFSDGATSAYDFSDQYRKFHCGLCFLADYRISGHLTASASLNWGLNHVFLNSFRTISFSMYPIYGNICIGYSF